MLPSDAVLADIEASELLEKVVDDFDEPPPRIATPVHRMRDPVLRQLQKQRGGREVAAGAPAGSWWTQPDADYQREQARMRAQGLSTVENLIGWKAVGTSSKTSTKGTWL